MSPKDLSVENFRELFVSGRPLVDVRAAIEFQQGHLPGAVNLPLLNDSERARVGTTYKMQGSDAAIALGHQLVSGAVKEARVQAWVDFFRQQPEAVLYCFRGGLRSRISREWIQAAGIARPLLIGGYKAARRFLLQESERFTAEAKLLVLSGPTGAGKTALLTDLSRRRAGLDLEALALHRGSAFGKGKGPQPWQATFENHLAVAILRAKERLRPGQALLVEDESRMIGRCVIPPLFFSLLRESSVVWVDEPLEARVENIFNDYIRVPALLAQGSDFDSTKAQSVFDGFKNSTRSIQKKLGGLRATEILSDIEVAEKDFFSSFQLDRNRLWIEKLLSWYYDPHYLESLERRQVHIHFRGTWPECRERLLQD